LAVYLDRRDFTIAAKAPCAIVPVAPKELSRPWSTRTPSGTKSRTGIEWGTAQTIVPRCGFSFCSCEFAATLPIDRAKDNYATAPAPPATASRCPMFALSDVHTISAPNVQSAPMTAPTSTGSPSAVPVPWASKATPRNSRAQSTDFRTASIRRHYADPLGAVMLALGPSF
jgi:hypothetical protein